MLVLRIVHFSLRVVVLSLLVAGYGVVFAPIF